MDTLKLADLRRLAEMEAGPAISLYMPTFRAGREVRQNAIRFKNLLHQASLKLEECGTHPHLAKELVERIAALEPNELWWQQQSDGLAAFVTRDFSETYRLPSRFEEQVIVNNHFHVKPLVPLVQSDGRFYVLAASQKSVRLFEGSRFSVDELEPESLPTDLRSALNIDEYVSSLQFHAGEAGRLISGGGLFYGHGGAGMDVQKSQEIRQFLRVISDGLKDALPSHEAPLVFMGGDYLYPMFREVCHHKGLVDTPIVGNHELLGADEIHDRAWEVVAPIFDATRLQALEHYNRLAGSDRSTDRIEHIVTSARLGQVDTLLANTDAEVWGVIDQESRQVRTLADGELGAESSTTDDLMNDAVLHTLINRGKVYSLAEDELPGSGPAVATLRYPLSQRGLPPK